MGAAGRDSKAGAGEGIEPPSEASELIGFSVKCATSGFLRAFLPHARAKKLPRAAECLVYSLTPSGVLAENHPKNRGFVGILRGQKCLKRRFSRRSPVGEWSRGARSMPRVFGRGSRSQPAALVINTRRTG